jgi:hypothetical protein
MQNSIKFALVNIGIKQVAVCGADSYTPCSGGTITGVSNSCNEVYRALLLYAALASSTGVE